MKAKGTFEPDFFGCPYCHGELVGAGDFACVPCGASYSRVDNIYRFYDKNRDDWQALMAEVKMHVESHNEVHPPSCPVGWPYINAEIAGIDGRARMALFNIAFELLAPIISSDDLCYIVDLGCFTGWSSYMLARHQPVIAIEPYEPALRTIDPTVGRGITRIVADGQYLPLADCSVDAIFMNSVYHHMRDKLVALNEWWRILKPGGILVATGESYMPADAPAEDACAGAWQGERSYFQKDMLETFDASKFYEISRLPVNYMDMMQYKTATELVGEEPGDNGIILARKLQEAKYESTFRLR